MNISSSPQNKTPLPQPSAKLHTDEPLLKEAPYTLSHVRTETPSRTSLLAEKILAQMKTEGTPFRQALGDISNVIQTKTPYKFLKNGQLCVVKGASENGYEGYRVLQRIKTIATGTFGKVSLWKCALTGEMTACKEVRQISEVEARELVEQKRQCGRKRKRHSNIKKEILEESVHKLRLIRHSKVSKEIYKEFEILRLIHKNGEIPGIQKAPIALVKKGGHAAYVAPAYIGDMTTPPALANLDYKTSLLNLAKGLQTVHSKGIIIGDIKPANVLFDQHTMVLSDFGSCFHTRDSHRLYIFGSHTPEFSDPRDKSYLKSIKKCFFNGQGLSNDELRNRAIELQQKRDIYALGKTFTHILVTSGLETQLTDAQQREFKNLIAKMTIFQWSNRPSAEEVANRLVEILFSPNPVEEAPSTNASTASMKRSTDEATVILETDPITETYQTAE